MRVLSYTVLSVLCLFGQSIRGQEAPSHSLIPAGARVTAAYATGGESKYIDNVLWLTWGAEANDNEETSKYGVSHRPIFNGSTSFARIDLGAGKFLEIAAGISNVQYRVNGANSPWIDVESKSSTIGLRSHQPGSYHGDFLDDLYNIGGTDAANRLISGISVKGDRQEIRFDITCRATLDGVPTKLTGMVLGDAESMADNENAEATGYGNWTVVDLMKNPGEGPYLVYKTDLGDGRQKLDILKGNNKKTGVVAFMTFSEMAYDTKENGYEVTFNARLKGGGLQAIALGLIAPALDGGDAPESYGAAWHLLEGFVPESDHIPVFKKDEHNSSEKEKFATNINPIGYVPGGLVAKSSSFLGSTAPDADGEMNFSKFADKDDKSGVAGLQEEDAWPLKYRVMTHKTYKNLDVFEVEIPYRSEPKAPVYIAGWIDLDGNGVFDKDEVSVVTAPSTGSLTGSVKLSWTVPKDVKPLGTFVRLRMANTKDDLMHPDGIAAGGEVEDHRIYIVSPTITNPMLPSKRNQKEVSAKN